MGSFVCISSYVMDNVLSLQIGCTAIYSFYTHRQSDDIINIMSLGTKKIQQMKRFLSISCCFRKWSLTEFMANCLWHCLAKHRVGITVMMLLLRRCFRRRAGRWRFIVWICWIIAMLMLVVKLWWWGGWRITVCLTYCNQATKYNRQTSGLQ